MFRACAWHNLCSDRGMLRSFTLPLALLTASAGLAGAIGSGCSEDPPFNLSDGGGGASSSNNGGSGGTFVDNGAELFAALEPELVTACGDCHTSGGIADSPFLSGPAVYESILSWPGIVTTDASDSLLLTYSVSGGGHTGINLDAVEGDLIGRVEDWLTAEAQNIAAPIDDEHLAPITPIMGLNVIYLTALDPELEGVAVTFTAEELTENSLKLSNLQVFTTAKTGVHVVHPVFAVYPKGADASADPVDSFAGLDERFDENTATTLGVGLLILTNWAPGAKLGLGFELAEPHSSMMGTGGAGGGGGPTGGCNALAEFDTNAAPQLQQRCFSCHGGNNQGATAAVDMSDLMTNSALACAQVKNRVNLTTPESSQLFVTTDPGGNASHPYKFGGNVGQFDDFVADLTVWISAE